MTTQQTQTHDNDNKFGQEVILVPANKIMPNPLNPREDDDEKSGQLMSILQNRGFEEPLTVYKKGNIYVLLAGHRRLNAAKKAGIKEIPVFVREAPKNPQEEIERIASLQSGRVDFTHWEWAVFTHERWIKWDRPAIKPFAEKINLKPASVKAYIDVMEYYPLHEIEKGMKQKTLNITTLHSLISWMKRIKEAKPNLVEDMTEDMIRTVMVDKIAKSHVYKSDLRNPDYLEHASEEAIRDFLISKSQKLVELRKLAIDKGFSKSNKEEGSSQSSGFAKSNLKVSNKQSKGFSEKLVTLDLAQAALKDFKPETDFQRDLAIKQLKELQDKITKQLDALK